MKKNFRCFARFLRALPLVQGLALIFSTGSFAEGVPVGVPRYGQLYVAEQSLHEVKAWRTSVSYGYEFGNSYQNVHHAKLLIERSWGRYAWMGIQASLYRGFETDLFQVLGQHLQSRDVELKGHAPLFSVYPVVTWSPIGGHFSFLREQPLEAELGIQVGAGYIEYAGASGRLGVLWALRPIIHFTPSLSFVGSFGQEVESIFRSQDRLSHVRGELGVAYQF